MSTLASTISAEMEVTGIMRGLSRTGQNYIQAFTKMVQEQESGDERKMEATQEAIAGGHQPLKPGDNAQRE